MHPKSSDYFSGIIVHAGALFEMGLKLPQPAEQVTLPVH